VKDTTSKAAKSSTFRLGDDISDAMARLEARDGIIPSEQARRALRPWLEKKGVLQKSKPERKRAGTRARP
jgi:hypothetical protein